MEKYGKLQAVLWDMDGVLLDSRLTHYRAFKNTFNKYGWEYNEEFLAEVFGAPNDSIFNLVTGNTLDAKEIARISMEKDKYFCDLIGTQAEFLPGTEKWLKQFSQDGVSQALATSGSWENIHTILGALQAEQYFEALVSGEDQAGKPDPYVFLHAAEKLDVAPECCLVIEDSPSGLQAAEAAGMRVLAITTTNPPENLKKADLILDDLTFLKDEMIAALFKA